MLERLRLSLWDIYSTLITGAIILAVSFYLQPVDALLPSLKLDSSKILIYLFVCYTLGLIYEPISKKLFSKIDKAYMKWLRKRLLKKIYKREKQKNEIDKAIQEILQQQGSFPQPQGTSDFNAFQYAKAVLRQYDISNDFLIYLARYGFYRNVCTLSLLITGGLAICFTLPGQFIQAGIVMLCGLLIHFFTYYAAKDFFILAGAEVYRHFLVWHKCRTQKADNTQDDA